MSETRWVRVTAENRCPICKKPDWCTISEDKSAVICPRIEEGSKKYIDGSGYLHILKETTEWKKELSKPIEKQLPEHNEVMAIMARKLAKTISEEKLVDLAEDLDVSIKSLKRLYVGYASNQDAYSFPMLRSGNRLIGIRFRNMEGRKWALKGSRQGLFLPKQEGKEQKGVLICEGPTDTGAALDMGFDCIGRPSCNSGSDLIIEAAKGRHVAIIADADNVGLDGAERLAFTLRSHCPEVVILVPPAKDLRAWVAEGCVRKDVLDLIKEKRNK
ncbi:MAG: hypothetical protein GOVbin1630_20 [Prokaryotic dsDNA virus sp.]|nr:MAG: hypothetical protein GOVbin1630_20 [Prokaryotic dsDNA virus sp.]|tara:strand:+ start:11791 stop:12609 length:819 start_codon:yes stop_codon:yes gene_type:complete